MNKNIIMAVSNLPQLEIVDTGYEVVAKHQLNDLYWGVSNSFPPRLERYLGEKKVIDRAWWLDWIYRVRANTY